MKILGIKVERLDSLNILVAYKGINTYHGSVESALRKIRNYKRAESLEASKDITELLINLKKLDEDFEAIINKLSTHLLEDNLKLENKLAL